MTANDPTVTGSPVAGPATRIPGLVPGTSRGQSSIDFVIGFGIFFLTFTFVVILIPDLLSPFAQQEGPAVADRAVETLSSDLLATGTLGTLNGTCTEEFFQKSGTDCSFDGSDPMTTLLGVSDQHSLNVTMERNVTAGPGTEVVCYDGTDVVACSSGDTVLARGRSPPGETQSVRTARRVVRVGDDDQAVVLKLRVW